MSEPRAVRMTVSAQQPGVYRGTITCPLTPAQAEGLALALRRAAREARGGDAATASPTVTLPGGIALRVG